MQGNRAGGYRFSAMSVALTASIFAAAASACAGDAAQLPSAERGQMLAQSLCINCHVLPGRDAGSVPAGVPTFHAIANRPGQTGEKISRILIKPHAPMPDIQLTRDEIVDILAYLETLRTNSSVPPLLPPSDQQPSPQTPSRS